jgi:hypothetical protein
MVVFTGWLFASSCSPPRLSATQLLSATKGQLPLRSGLSPNCWCALVGALGGGFPPPGKPLGRGIRPLLWRCHRAQALRAGFRAGLIANVAFARLKSIADP